MFHVGIKIVLVKAGWWDRVNQDGRDLSDVTARWSTFKTCVHSWPNKSL